MWDEIRWKVIGASLKAVRWPSELKIKTTLTACMWEDVETGAPAFPQCCSTLSHARVFWSYGSATCDWKPIWSILVKLCFFCFIFPVWALPPPTAQTGPHDAQRKFKKRKLTQPCADETLYFLEFDNISWRAWLWSAVRIFLSHLCTLSCLGGFSCATPQWMESWGSANSDFTDLLQPRRLKSWWSNTNVLHYFPVELNNNNKTKKHIYKWNRDRRSPTYFVILTF